MAVRPFHCVMLMIDETQLDATVSGSVLVQVTVPLEACQVKTGDTSLSRPA